MAWQMGDMLSIGLIYCLFFASCLLPEASESFAMGLPCAQGMHLKRERLQMFIQSRKTVRNHQPLAAHRSEDVFRNHWCPTLASLASFV